MHVSNLHDYGHLLNGDTYDTSHLHGDMYQMFDNTLVRKEHDFNECLCGGCGFVPSGLGEEVYSC